MPQTKIRPWQTPAAVAFCAVSLGHPATAEDGRWCQALWLDRNTVMDRAGHCFDTPLGQALFDNADCTAGDRPLSPLDSYIVSRIEEREAQSGCDVDTSARALYPSLDARLRQLRELWTVPIRADTEHFCGDYSGPARDLHAGMSIETSVIGRLEPGMGFNFSYEQMRGGWEYILVSDAEHTRVGHGWVQGIEMTADLCGLMAG